MIDLTASDDVESSQNVERNFQRLFPSMHAQAENGCTDCLSCIPSLACHSAVLSRSLTLSNRSVAKSNVMGNNNLLRRATHRGKSSPRPMPVAVASP